MTRRSLPLLILTALVAGSAGWYFGRHPSHPLSSPASPPNADSRRILFYQSAMHPWIKSDKPGKCTICGMDLTPVFEGDTATPLDPSLVALGSNAISVLHVQTVPARHGTLIRTLHVAGVLNDDDTRRRVLSAWVAGRIDQLHVNFVGAEVAAGQPLARFYSPMLLEAERQFLALRSPSDAAPAASDLPFLRESAILRLRQLGLADSQIDRLPSKPASDIFSEILAPSGGTVVSRFVYPGQYVMEGEKLFEIADFSTLWFLFDAYEQDLPFLAPGQEIEVTSPSTPGQVFRSPIRFVDPNLDAMTRSTKVRVEVTNPVVAVSPQIRRALPHRGYAEGRVRVETPQVLVVPRSAVLAPDDRPVVYVDRGEGIYEQRPVRLGRFGDADYEVLEGLAADEPVVVRGNLLIDAQAQLHRTLRDAEESTHRSHVSHPTQDVQGTPTRALTSPSPRRPSPPPPPPLLATQAKDVRAFLVAADQLRVALAADDLPGFETAWRALPPALERARASLEASPDTQALAARLRTSLPSGADADADLRSARRRYHGLAVNLVALGRDLRALDPAFHDLRIYRCPMTAEAFEGAPPRAEWLQLAPPLRNPWFGAEMLECGVEVRDQTLP